MSEVEEKEPYGGRASVVALAARTDRPTTKEITSFDRRELDQILRIYGRKVAEGEWRDYALDFLRDRAVFSVFRRTTEFPLYRIEKNPKLARRQGAYAVIAPNGLVLKRGHDLGRVLRVLEKPVRLVVG
jgi:hypothetical protein